MEIKGNGKGYLRGTVVDLMETAGNGRGWVPRKHYHKLPKPRKTTENYKRHPKPPKLLKTIKI
jgi:hypothetical protein